VDPAGSTPGRQAVGRFFQPLLRGRIAFHITRIPGKISDKSIHIIGRPRPTILLGGKNGSHKRFPVNPEQFFP
jgi:hypothetical protein